MKAIRQWLVFGLVGVLAGAASAQEDPWTYSAAELAAIHQGLKDGVEKGCPVRFEDIYDIMVNDTQVADDLWTVNGAFDQADKDAFELEYRSGNNDIAGEEPSDAEVIAVMVSADAIRYECNAHRLNLLQYILDLNQNDTSTSITAATGVLYALDFESDGWERGDVRVTGRKDPAQGWLFLDGKTIGSAGSTAYHKGDQYEELFEIIIGWGSTASSGTWATNGTVALPDMRGRAIFGQNDMGGSIPPSTSEAVTAVGAEKIGGTFGKEKYAAILPTHNHAMNNGGASHAHTSNGAGHHAHGVYNSPSHSHSMGLKGGHGHSIRTSVYTGSNVPNYGTYFEGKGRPGYESTKSAPVLAAPHHNHTVGNGGVHNHSIVGAGNHAHGINAANAQHKHTVLNAGTSSEFTTTSPGAAFNVEMKY